MATKESDQQFAGKLLGIYIKQLVHKMIAVYRGDYTQKELRKMIKNLEAVSDE